MWHDSQTNTVIYETQDPRLLQWIPDARPVNGRYIAFPATIPNLQIARVFNYPALRVLNSYSYPRNRTLVPQPFFAQTETANVLVVNPRACCLNDMGTGKTLSALWAADALMADYHGRGTRVRAIICAPLSTLQSVWLDALILHFSGRRRGVIVHGSPEKRMEAMKQDVDFYIINHDGIKGGAKVTYTHKNRPPVIKLSGLSEHLSQRDDIRIAVIDEIGAFRDNRTDRSRIARILLGQRDHLWGLTGTPTPNSPVDAYGIAKLMNNARGESRTSFENRTMYPISRFKKVPRHDGYEEAMKLLAPYVRFSIDACQDLPPLTIQNRHVELSREQRERMKELKRELILYMEGGKIDAVNEAALRIKLMQICCGAVYDQDHTAHEIDVSPRMAALSEIIDEAGKVLVFAPFTSAVNILNRDLKKFSRGVITGQTSLNERTKLMRAFQTEDDPRVLLANAEPISRGQTLTAACVSVWWSAIDKTETYMQANKRIHRPGQQRPCTVVNLSGSPVETETYRRLANNESMQGLMLKMMEMGL